MVRIILSLLLAVPLIVGTVSSDTGIAPLLAQRAPEVIEVSAIDLAFEPSEITAAPGDIIRLTNNGALPHNIAIEDAGVATEVQAGGGVDEMVIPDDLAPGTYGLLCEVPGHAQAGMVGTLTIVAVVTDTSDSTDDGDTAAELPNLDVDLGDGWEVADEGEIDLGERSGGGVPAAVTSLTGPESSLARIVVADVDVANGRPTYDRWAEFVGVVGAGLVPVDDSDIPEVDGCLLQASVQGDEPLTGARIGSTVCLTDDDRFIWASVSGQWEADEDPVSYAEASVHLVELVLDETG